MAFRNRVFSLFDVSLRDGLQSLRRVVPLADKQAMFREIVQTRRPAAIEVGSLVSPKVLPQMSGSDAMFRYASEYVASNSLSTDLYMAVPPTRYRLDAAFGLGVKNVSIMASVSDAFQNANVGMSCEDTHRIIVEESSSKRFDKMKVYLSCIEYCPVSGRFTDIEKMADAVCSYVFHSGISEVCLSDTTGSMRASSAVMLMAALAERQVSTKDIGVHLHKMGDNAAGVHRLGAIFLAAGVTKIDVSNLRTGGCSVTMEESDLHANTHYDDIEPIYVTAQCIGDSVRTMLPGC